MNYFTNVSASIVGGLITILIVPIISRKARELYVKLLATIFGMDLAYVYKNKEEANRALQEDVPNSRLLKVLTARGNDFQQDAFTAVVDDRKVFEEAKILLPNPFDCRNVDWFKQREEELHVFDKSFGWDVLKHQTKANILYLINHIKKERIEVRTHQFPLIGRIVITDKHAYFTPMLKDRYIRRNKTYKYNVGGEMYCYYTRLFDQFWIDSEDVRTILSKKRKKKKEKRKWTDLKKIYSEV